MFFVMVWWRPWKADGTGAKIQNEHAEQAIALRQTTRATGERGNVYVHF